MKLHIYSLQSTVHEGESDSVTLPTESGEISVLNHHIPLITTLKKGTVTAHSKDSSKEFTIRSGMAYTDGEQLVVLAD
ncbi:MAG TPA: F0F1 ATP synthase subunit epsilon [Candidatus Paceibacterota bacterium]